jgi:hypothetical protein
LPQEDLGFGDPPDSRTVEGKRLAAMKAAETRRLKPIQKDHEEFEQDRNSWPARLGEFLDWWSTHLKFRSWKVGR